MSCNFPSCSTIPDRAITGNPFPCPYRAFAQVRALVGGYARFDAEKVRTFINAGNPALWEWIMRADAETLRSRDEFISDDRDRWLPPLVGGW